MQLGPCSLSRSLSNIGSENIWTIAALSDMIRASFCTWSSLCCVCDSYYWQTAIWHLSSNKNRRRNADSAKYKEALMSQIQFDSIKYLPVQYSKHGDMLLQYSHNVAFLLKGVYHCICVRSVKITDLGKWCIWQVASGDNICKQIMGQIWTPKH